MPRRKARLASIIALYESSPRFGSRIEFGVVVFHFASLLSTSKIGDLHGMLNMKARIIAPTGNFSGNLLWCKAELSGREALRIAPVLRTLNTPRRLSREDEPHRQ